MEPDDSNIPTVAMMPLVVPRRNGPGEAAADTAPAAVTPTAPTPATSISVSAATPAASSPEPASAPAASTPASSSGEPASAPAAPPIGSPSTASPLAPRPAAASSATASSDEGQETEILRPLAPPPRASRPAPPAPPARRPSPGCLMPVVWIVLTLLVTLGSAGGVGFAISTGEEAGKTAALIAAFPLAFCWSALLAALGLQLFKKGGTGVRVGLPLGCGFLGALVFFGLVAGFLLVIFPQL